MEIISNYTVRSSRFLSLFFFFLATPGLFGTELTLQKVPPLTVEQAPAYPENLARYHLGARVEAAPKSNPIADLRLSSKSEDQNVAEAALLCDDPTVGYALPAGITTLLVSLPKIENVQSISFLNTGAKGDVTIATASAKLPADSPQWRNAAQQQFSADAVKATVGPSEAKYVRLTFNVSEPGRIAGLGVYSAPAISDFTMPRPRNVAVQDKSESFALISYNYTDLHAKARALYVSSGNDVKQANNMIDDQPATTYSFAAEDGSPATVIDLGKVCTLRRLSAVYSPRAGSMEFYVLQSLPGTQRNPAMPLDMTAPETSPAPSFTPETSPPSMTLDDAAFAALTPVGSASDDGSRGRASIDFAPTSGRYVMVRWTPAAQQGESFSLAEIAAFGGSAQGNTLLAANTTVSNGPGEGPDEDQAVDGKTVLDGKTTIDTKDMPFDGPAEAQAPGEGPPPSLPQPPPFTFVPVLLPTSP
jgi:hypothetical protein